MVVSSVQAIASQISSVNQTMLQQNDDIEGIVESSTEVAEISRSNAESGQQLLQDAGELGKVSEKLDGLAQGMHSLVKDSHTRA